RADHALAIGPKLFVAHREIANLRKDNVVVESHGSFPSGALVTFEPRRIEIRLATRRVMSGSLRKPSLAHSARSTTGWPFFECFAIAAAGWLSTGSPGNPTPLRRPNTAGITINVSKVEEI